MNKLKVDLERRDTFVRHAFQLLIGWFTFFITVNWASMGWIAVSLPNGMDGTVLSKVAYVFAFQGVLGVTITGIVGHYFHKESKHIQSIEEMLYKDEPTVQSLSSPYPIRVYLGTVILMIVALLPMIWVWWWLTEFVRGVA